MLLNEPYFVFFDYICRMLSIRRIQRWLKGVGHLRGFGIQSPFAYSLLRDVFDERAPYYKYVELDQQFPSLTRRKKKILRLLFRLANHLQAPSYYVDSHLDRAVPSFIHAGSLRSRPVTRPSEASFCIFSSHSTSALDDFMNTVDNSKVLVLFDIYTKGEKNDVWSRVLASEKVKVTFDFYTFGVAFYKASLHRNDYILNF
jgi:hypothetical protein